LRQSPTLAGLNPSRSRDPSRIFLLFVGISRRFEPLYSTGAVQADAFKLRMEEVVGAANFENLTAKVVKREQPLFSKTPLE
jgi:hypothetical protein